MSNPETATAYQIATSALVSSAQEQGQPMMATSFQRVLDDTLAARGWTSESLTAEQLQGLLFPDLDRAYSSLLDEEPRRRMLREISELLAAQELGAIFTPKVAEADLGLTEPKAAASHSAAENADSEEDDEDWDFGEDEFELEDPEYLAAQETRAYNLTESSEQSRLITDLGRISGVQSVMVCRQNGEVLDSRSLRDLSSLGGVVAATVLLLRGRSLRLMSAQVGSTIVCVRPLGEYAVAVLADPSVNIGRLLSELGQVKGQLQGQQGQAQA